MAITTSQTEINAIDALYPVAGQDNDSQDLEIILAILKPV